MSAQTQAWEEIVDRGIRELGYNPMSVSSSFLSR